MKVYSNRLRTGLGLQQPTGAWTNGFGYDSTKRLTSIVSPAGTFGYTYESGVFTHHPSRITLPNTSYITNIFDTDARLTDTYLKNSGNTVLDSYSYIYNPSNQRTSLTRADASTVAYKYDPIGQLKVADSSVNTEDYGYFYDSAWNVNFRTNNGGVTIFQVNPKNELTNHSAPNGYDLNGNLTNRESEDVLVYDDENRLTLISGELFQNFRTAFAYDGLGRLRIRTEYSWSGSAWVADSVVNYIYDGWRVIQERDFGNTPTVSYTRGNDLSGSMEGAGGIGGLLARSSGYSGGNFTTHNYYYADGNGNITYMLNSSQSMVAKYRYDPFGNTISSSGALASDNVYRFSSKETHVNSGMYYYGYRFYDPNLQRWINRDPIGERGGLNLFEFASNDSLDFIDRLGLYVVPTDFPPAANKDTVICFNGKLTIQNKDKGPDRKCTGEHEYSHLQDWLKRYGEDVCKGKKNGSVPVGGDGYNEFLRQSECKAYKAGKKCREKLLATCKEKDKASIQAGIDRDNAQLMENNCEP